MQAHNQQEKNKINHSRKHNRNRFEICKVSYLWVVKVRKWCYAFDVFDSELVLWIG